MLSYSSKRYYGRLGRPDDRWIPVKWNLNRIHIPPCHILYLPFDATSNGFLLKASLSLPYGIFVPGRGRGRGWSYFPYILLNLKLNPNDVLTTCELWNRANFETKPRRADTHVPATNQVQDFSRSKRRGQWTAVLNCRDNWWVSAKAQSCVVAWSSQKNSLPAGGSKVNSPVSRADTYTCILTPGRGQARRRPITERHWNSFVKY